MARAGRVTSRPATMLSATDVRWDYVAGAHVLGASPMSRERSAIAHFDFTPQLVMFQTGPAEVGLSWMFANLSRKAM